MVVEASVRCLPRLPPSISLHPETAITARSGDSESMLYGSGNEINPAEQKQLLANLLSQAIETDSYPASLAQQRLWFLDQIQHQSSAYNVHLGLRLKGTLVLDSLRAALQEIV